MFDAKYETECTTVLNYLVFSSSCVCGSSSSWSGVGGGLINWGSVGRSFVGRCGVGWGGVGFVLLRLDVFGVLGFVFPFIPSYFTSATYP